MKTAASLGFNVGRANVGITVHALRRFFKTSAYNAGAPKPLIDRWIGHAGDEIDHHYYDPSMSKDWMDKLPFGDVTASDVRRMGEK